MDTLITTPLVRWTIGPVRKAGFDCLEESVCSFRRIYPNTKIVICHNQLTPAQVCRLEKLKIPLLDQIISKDSSEISLIPPIGVAWKLYPPRLSPDTHELFIDNDLVIEDRVEEIDRFLAGDMTLLLQETTRHYGKFERHVPPGYCINSGLFGLPPGFPFGNYIKFYASSWEENCGHASRTWDEQGLVAAILLAYKRSVIIPFTTITNCEKNYTPSKGMHFIGLNRRTFHIPFADYKTRNIKMYL
jgi:hypothetical protein